MKLSHVYVILVSEKIITINQLVMCWLFGPISKGDALLGSILFDQLNSHQ